MAEASKLFNPDKQIDCTGLFCPMPIVKTREAIKEMAVGQLLEMLSDDPGSDPDMKSWARATGNELDRCLPAGRGLPLLRQEDPVA